MIQNQYKIKKVYPDDIVTLQEELKSITIENIKQYPSYRKKWDDFYSMWQRFGPDAARTILIPYIWDGRIPRPSEARLKNVR